MCGVIGQGISACGGAAVVYSCEVRVRLTEVPRRILFHCVEFGTCFFVLSVGWLRGSSPVLLGSNARTTQMWGRYILGLAGKAGKEVKVKCRGHCCVDKVKG